MLNGLLKDWCFMFRLWTEAKLWCTDISLSHTPKLGLLKAWWFWAVLLLRSSLWCTVGVGCVLEDTCTIRLHLWKLLKPDSGRMFCCVGCCCGFLFPEDNVEAPGAIGASGCLLSCEWWHWGIMSVLGAAGLLSPCANVKGLSPLPWV